MRRAFTVLLLCPLLAVSAPAQTAGEPLDGELKRALADQASADAQTARLEQVAARAKGEADRLYAEQAAAAQAIDAAEARIGAADARLRLASAYVSAFRQRLAVEQQPVSALLAGLATMSRRPPLLALADRGGTDELVKVRLLLDSTMPFIRTRTAQLSAQLVDGQRLQQTALVARTELSRSRDELVVRRKRYAALEQKAVQRSLMSGGQALAAGDASMAAGESVDKLRGEETGSQSIRIVASQIAAEDPAPASPFASGAPSLRPPFAYELPAAAAVTQGVDAVGDSGVQSRGLELATYRGAPVSAPASGIVKYSGPFHGYDGVLIIDHGGGWMTLLVNVASTLHAGDKIALGDSVGRALGPLQVELSQNGRRISPAIIAGSSASLSKAPKGG